MAATNGGVFNVQRTHVTADSSGNWIVTLIYTNATSGKEVVRRLLTVPADSTKPITDQNGNIVAATVPTALASALSSALSQLDSSISSGAAGGKPDL